MIATERKADPGEMALSRAITYRLLSLACTYPTGEACDALRDLVPSARVAASLFPRRVQSPIAGLCEAIEGRRDAELERAYLAVFTATSSPTCPAHETAYTAKHLFQVSEQMADVAGFYRAFGVEPHADRPDALAMELEFAYLLAVKEAHACEHHGRARVLTCRAAQRAFLRDHLGRWGQAVATRMIAEGGDDVVGRAGALLAVFLTDEMRRLRAGPSHPLPAQPYQAGPADAEPPCLAVQ